MAGQAHVAEENLEEEVGKGARVVPTEQEDREQTLPLPHEPWMRTLWAPGPERALWVLGRPRIQSPALSLLRLPRHRTRWWLGVTRTVRTVMRWSFLYSAHSPPLECKRSAKTSWRLLFSPTRIYGPLRRPTVQSPSAVGCMTTTMFCPPRPQSLRINCPTHADLFLLADRRDAAPRPTASCWTCHSHGG